jgi:hypothetical protein
MARAHPAGVATLELARAMSYDQHNVYLTLRALERPRLVRKDRNVRPQLYYLTETLTSGVAEED